MRWRLAGLLLFAACPAMALPCEGRYPNATPLPTELREARLSHAWGRENIAPLPGETGAFRIRYPAGSINPGNAAAIFALPNVDGALVGGASLKASDFGAIISALSAR